MTELPFHVKRLLEVMREIDMTAGAPLPTSVDALAKVAPDLAVVMTKLGSGEIALLCRCLSEAEVTLLYEECDAQVAGSRLSPGARRRVFLHSLQERLHRAYARVS